MIQRGCIAQKYLKVKLLASTPRANVYVCHPLDNPDELVSVKEYKSSEPFAFYESMIHNRISETGSNHLLQLKEEIITSENIYLVTEYCENGDLASNILDVRKWRKLVEDPYKVSCQVRNLIEGLQTIHNLGYHHQDIKPQNIFVDKDRNLKFGDFGETEDGAYENQESLNVQRGTAGYIHPKFGVKKTQKDIWALGKTIFELLIGRLVILTPNQFDIESEVKKAIKNSGFNENFAILINYMLQMEPNPSLSSNNIAKRYNEVFDNFTNEISLNPIQNDQNSDPPIETEQMFEEIEYPSNEELKDCTLCSSQVLSGSKHLDCGCFYHTQCLIEFIKNYNLKYKSSNTIMCLCGKLIQFEMIRDLKGIEFLVKNRELTAQNTACPECRVKSSCKKLNERRNYQIVKCQYCATTFCSLCNDTFSHQKCLEHQELIAKFELQSQLS